LIPSDQEEIGLATHLAILDIALPGGGGLVDGRLVPLSATRALETRVHALIL
jgi:hypothetical protein